MPNMDKMAPEEYREALVRKIEQSAAARRNSGSRDFGAQAASNYMDNLTKQKKVQAYSAMQE